MKNTEYKNIWLMFLHLDIFWTKVLCVFYLVKHLTFLKFSFYLGQFSTCSSYIIIN